MSKRIFTASPKKNYGGAFDIDPEMFFTRDDLDELNEAVLDYVSGQYPGQYKVCDSYIDGPDNQDVHISIEDEDHVVYDGAAHIDMRKIRSGHDLAGRYAQYLAWRIIDSIEEYRGLDEDDINSCSNVSAATVSVPRLDALKDKFYNATIQAMNHSTIGYTLEEAGDYVHVDVTEVEGGYIKIEVRAEVSFDGMMEISEVLDKLVEEIDETAYFDFDAPGIMYAYVEAQKAINSSTAVLGYYNNMEDNRLNPPEYDEPNEADEYQEEYYLDLDAIIILDEDGSWEYEDENYDWAKVNHDGSDVYCSDPYEFLYVSDVTGMVEATDDLLATMLPAEPGRYHITGQVTLVYDVSDILYYRDYLGVDEDGDPDYEDTVDESSGEVKYNFKDSNIKNFRCVKVEEESIASSTEITASVKFTESRPASSPRNGYDMYANAEYERVTFSIHYNSIDTSPEADPAEMFKAFKANVSESHPYDDGDYLFARVANGVVRFFRNGAIKPEEVSYYAPADKMDVENEEWCDAVLEDVIIQLRELNKSTKSKMIHN